MDETVNDFVICDGDRETQIDSEAVSPYKTLLPVSLAHSTSINGTMEITNMEILEENNSDRVHGETGCVIATVKNGVHDAFLAAIDTVVNRRVELVIRLAKASLESGPKSIL